MNLDQLRKETAAEHQAVETTVPLMDADLTKDRYLQVLLRFQRILCAWDSWSLQHAPSNLHSLVACRQRCPLLHRDLRFFGHSVTEPKPHPLLLEDLNLILEGDAAQQNFSGEELRSARFLGAMYVVEGSTLGGQYMALHVEKHFGLVPGQGNAYFRGYGEETGPMWREFQATLRTVPDQNAHILIEAAKRMFSVFGRWMTASD